jgi:hypothetical protein
MALPPLMLYHPAYLPELIVILENPVAKIIIQSWQFGLLFFSFPSNIGEHFLNLGIRSRFLTMKPNTPLIFAVDQLSFILEKEKVKTIIKVEDHDTEILPRLKKISHLQERVGL